MSRRSPAVVSNTPLPVIQAGPTTTYWPDLADLLFPLIDFTTAWFGTNPDYTTGADNKKGAVRALTAGNLTFLEEVRRQLLPSNLLFT